MPRLSHFVYEYLLALPAGALLALLWANIAPESYYRFAYSMAFVVDDIAMVFFFGLITKEVVEATAPGGVLHTWRRVLMPVAAAVGAAVVPALFYLLVVRLLEEPMLLHGWPVVIAIDLAVGYFCARAIFGRHPIVPFLLLLMIAANGIGFLVMAVASPRPGNVAAGVLILAAGIAVSSLLRRARVRSFWPYVLLGGGLSWTGLFVGGIHPALALVPILPFVPHGPRDPGFFVDARPGARDPLSHFEVWCRHPAQVALFFFGLINAGVVVRTMEPGVWALPLAVLVGKPIGILAACGIAVAAGLHLPARVTWRELIVAGLLAGIGFTMALFFATAVLGPGQLLNELKMGGLLSLALGGIAAAAAWALRVGRFGAGE